MVRVRLLGQRAPLLQLVATAALDRLHRDARLLEPPTRLRLRRLLGPPIVEHAPQHRVLDAQQPLELLVRVRVGVRVWVRVRVRVRVRIQG